MYISRTKRNHHDASADDQQEQGPGKGWWAFVVDGRSLAGRFEVAQALNYSNRKQHLLAEGNAVVVVHIH